jgi:ATP-binding cassette, subfamily B, bacterial
VWFHRQVTRVRWILRVTESPWPALLLVAVLGLLAGFGEAGALVVIVSLSAGTISGDQATVVGPFELGASTGQLVAFGSALVALSLVSNIASAGLSARLISDAVRRLQDRLLAAHLRASVVAQSRLPEGKLSELMGLGAYQASTGLGGVINCVTAAALLFAYVVIAVASEPMAAIVASLAGGVLLLVVRPIGRIARAANRRYVDRQSEFLQWSAQTESLAMDFRVFGVEGEVLDEASVRNGVTAAEGRRMRFLVGIAPAIYQSAALGLVLVGVLAARTADAADPTALAAVAVLLVRALSLTQRLSLAVQGVGVAAPHIEDVLDTTEGFENEHHAPGTLPVVAGSVLQAAGVGYAYNGDVPVLRDVSFDVRHGESVAIVGPSGSGKSTLFQLLLRLRHPTTGTVAIDGVDIWDLSDASFREFVALVPQDNRLVLGSIADNVRFLRKLEDSQVRDSLARAAIDDEVLGSSTQVGTGVSQLSGGQRQRVGLARALAGEPRILLLDEPTSALDHATERIVNETLRSVRGEMTVIVIAHRASTVAACDRIIVLEEGRLVADGWYDEVAATNGYVRGMFARSDT